MLSIFDIKELKGKGQIKVIWIYAVFMAIAIGLSVWYSIDHHQTSILEILFNVIGEGKIYEG